MFNNKYGDEGLVKLLNKEISKASDEMNFLGDLKELKAYILLSVNYINPFTYYYINDTLTNIVKVLNSIENDYQNASGTYEVKEVIILENKIDELKIKLNNYGNSEIIVNKMSALFEVIYAKCLRVERSYYRLNKTFRFQSYLNRLNDYFYILKDYVNKEM